MPRRQMGMKRSTHAPTGRALRRFVLAACALCAYAFAALAVAAPADDYPAGSRIEWSRFEAALFSRARVESRPLFLYFHGQWCSWCRDFQADSLEHPAVVRILRRDYIPVLIDQDRRRDLFARYGGRGLPFVVIIDERGKVLGRFTGHVGPADLARVLNERRQQVSATGREVSPADAAIDSVEAFLAMLDEVYEPASRRLGGSALFGTLSKRPQPWTLTFLLTRPEWSERMPGLLDQVIADLHDPDDGGFFFFHDPDQRAAGRARETSKRLDQNAAFVWLFADAYARLGEPRYREVAERSLEYLRVHLWDAEQKRFFNSQYSDDAYYALPPHARGAPPAVDRTTYADSSGQAIAALVRAAQALDDRRLLDWAGSALAGLERLRAGGGYAHALTPDGQRELTGYLPAQVWPGIAWRLYAQTAGHGDARSGRLLRQVAGFYDARLGGYRERLTDAQAAWIETRTQAALAWWLATTSAAEAAAAGVDPGRVYRWLAIRPGADPDDAALGFWALAAVGRARP